MAPPLVFSLLISSLSSLAQANVCAPKASLIFRNRNNKELNQNNEIYFIRSNEIHDKTNKCLHLKTYLNQI